MKVLYTTIGVGLFLVMGINYGMDPGHQWYRGHNDYPSRRLEKGEIWLWPPITEDHIARWEQIKTIAAPDLVSFGSCRSLAVDSTFFKPSVAYFNSAIGEITAFDFAALWQAFRENRKSPRYLIIFVDPWIINSHNFVINRWGYNADYVDRFVGSRPLGVLNWGRLCYQRIKAPFMIRFVKMQMLLHVETLLKSVRSVLHREPETPEIVREQDRPQNRKAYRWDGAMSEDDSPLNTEAIRELAIIDGRLDPINNLGRWKLDTFALKMISMLIEDLSRERVKVMFIIIPYHPVLLDIMNHRPGYAQIFPEVARTFDHLVEGYPNASVCNAVNSKASGCSESEFAGSLHMAKGCIQKTLRRCLGPQPEWRDLLPTPSKL